MGLERRDGAVWTAKDGDQWRALVNTQIYLRISYNFGGILEQLNDWQVL
jgi:hypothetical protein